MNKKLLVTGGLGFIGSYFVEMALKKGYSVINIDKKTYAARRDLNFEEHPHYEYIQEDICHLRHLPVGIDAIINFAAESHVDNSILANGIFFESNIRGVYNLLELIRAKDPTDRPLLLHISTDEVYGPIEEGIFTEKDILKPSSPYSATKAAAEQLIMAWGTTYDIDYKLCRSCNNYGYGQYPEKLFAKTVKNVLNGEKMTIHGSGSYMREWLYAEDNCEAVFTVLEKGTLREIYNISCNEEYSVLEVVEMIIKTIGLNPEEYIEFVNNRPGQDSRYAVDWSKIKALGWTPRMTIENYIPQYIELYKKNQS